MDCAYFLAQIDHLDAQIDQLQKDNAEYRWYINKFGVLEKVQDSESLRLENDTLKLKNESLSRDIAQLRKSNIETNKEINGWREGVGVPRGARVHPLVQSVNFDYFGNQIGPDGRR